MHTVRMPGVADRLLKDSAYPHDEPQRWARYCATSVTRFAGKGYSVSVTLSTEDWDDLRDYLYHYIGALAEVPSACSGMEASERLTNLTELRALRTVYARIDAALPQAQGGAQ